MKDNDKQSIIDAIAAMPCALEAEDVTDFCSLAQYYAMKTPSSFKQDLYPIIFGDGFDEKCISHALCLPVSAQELVENSIESPSIPNTSVESVKFFLVDCRPAEQYNAGHLPTAFHLDCNLVCSFSSFLYMEVLFKFINFILDASRTCCFCHSSTRIVASTTPSISGWIASWW